MATPNLRNMLALALSYPATPMGYVTMGKRGVPKVSGLAFWDRIATDVCRALCGLDCLYVTQDGKATGKTAKRACKACDARERGLCSRHAPEKRGRGCRTDLHDEGKRQKGGRRTYHVGVE